MVVPERLVRHLLVEHRHGWILHCLLHDFRYDSHRMQGTTSRRRKPKERKSSNAATRKNLLRRPACIPGESCRTEVDPYALTRILLHVQLEAAERDLAAWQRANDLHRRIFPVTLTEQTRLRRKIGGQRGKMCPIIYQSFAPLCRNGTSMCAKHQACGCSHAQWSERSSCAGTSISRPRPWEG